MNLSAYQHSTAIRNCALLGGWCRGTGQDVGLQSWSPAEVIQTALQKMNVGVAAEFVNVSNPQLNPQEPTANDFRVVLAVPAVL